MAEITNSEEYDKALEQLAEASKDYDDSAPIGADTIEFDLEKFCAFYRKRKVSTVLAALIFFLGWVPNVPKGAIDALTKIKAFLDATCPVKPS